MLMVAVAVTGAGMAGGQTAWTTDAGVTRITSCYVVKGGVRCDMTYTRTAEGRENLFVTTTDMFQVITTDGRSFGPSAVAVAGGGFETYGGTTVYKGAPVQFSVLFELPATTNTLRVLAYKGEPLNNIPVRSSATPAPAPRPTTTTSPANTSNYNAVMTNCTPGANGTLTCTATLTPRR